MQTANCYVEIGGDSGTTVPKYAITVSEIAVLRLIHGPDSVKEIEPTDDVEVSDRAEIKRLHEIYSRIDKPDGPVFTLFPGAAARAFQTLDELELPEEFFKAEKRVKPKPAEKSKAVKAKKADGTDDKDDAPEAPTDIEAKLAEEDKLFD